MQIHSRDTFRARLSLLAHNHNVLHEIYSLFLGLGKLVLPPKPDRPGLMAIRSSTVNGGCYA